MSLFSSIVRRHRKPDPFEADVLAHLDSLYASARRMTRNVADAEDLVQDVMIKAVRGRKKFEDGTNFKAWLFTILTNTYINQHRRGGMEREIVSGPDARPLSEGWVGSASMLAMCDAESHMLRPIVEKEVGNALERLPEEFRIAVLLSDVEDFSYREIGEIMGCPVGTVMSRLHRGRRLLKQSLQNHAVEMGILKPDEVEAEDAVGPDEAKTVCLEEYRNRKLAGRGV